MLEELNNRLALEKQETQPMRRDQIRRELALLSGNLPPADLPNPHEPVRSEETADGHTSDWTSLQASTYHLTTNGEERENIIPLLGDTISGANGHGNSRALVHPEGVPPPGDSQYITPSTIVRQNWLMRLLRFSSQK